MKIIVFLLALTLLTAITEAQDPAPLVRSNTRVVLLDVVVTDKEGKPVPNLKSDDFTVIENGVPQKISSFEAPISTQSATALPNSPRTIILLDELNIAYADLSYARDQTLRFLEQNHWEHNPTAVMAVGLHGLKVIQEYTQDEKLLRDALKQFHPALANPVEGVVEEGKAAEYALHSIGGLLDIARASVGSAYNLNVIWITSGFAGSLKETKSADGSQNGLRHLANLLTTARMRLYTIDPGGVKPLQATAVATPMTSTHHGLYSGQSMTNASAEEDLLSQNVTYEANQLLDVLTKMTGGHAYYGRNDVAIALDQAVVDGTSNYSISYAPSNSDFKGEYRKIEIRTNVEGTSARTRLGYYAVAEDASQSPEGRSAKWQAALTSPLSYTAFNLACPITYDAATLKATGTITSKPTPIVMESPQQSVEMVQAAALSNSGDILTAWSWQISWKMTWTNRVSPVTFDKVVPKKTKSLRFLVSDPAGEHIGTCDYRISQ